MAIDEGAAFGAALLGGVAGGLWPRRPRRPARRLSARKSPCRRTPRRPAKYEAYYRDLPRPVSGAEAGICGSGGGGREGIVRESACRRSAPLGHGRASYTRACQRCALNCAPVRRFASTLRSGGCAAARRMALTGGRPTVITGPSGIREGWSNCRPVARLGRSTPPSRHRQGAGEISRPRSPGLLDHRARPPPRPL